MFEVVEKALLCKPRKPALVLGYHGDLINCIARNVRPKVQRSVKTMHDIDGFNPVESSEVVLLQFTLIMVGVIQENFRIIDNHCVKLLLPS